jgi:hypothetical protein
MNIQRLKTDLVSELRARPYGTLSLLISVGWVLGRTVPLRAVLALAGVGARAAMTVAIEDVARPRSSARAEEATI